MIGSEVLARRGRPASRSGVVPDTAGNEFGGNGVVGVRPHPPWPPFQERSWRPRRLFPGERCRWRASPPPLAPPYQGGERSWRPRWLFPRGTVSGACVVKSPPALCGDLSPVSDHREKKPPRGAVFDRPSWGGLAHVPAVVSRNWVVGGAHPREGRRGPESPAPLPEARSIAYQLTNESWLTGNCLQ